MYNRAHPDWLHHSVVRELHSQGPQGPTQCGQVCGVHHRQGAPSPAGHLPHTMPQESWQDPKRLVSSSLQTFHPAAFWKVVPLHSVSHTQTGEQFLPQGHQAAKWTLILHRHFCTRHLHALSLSLSYYCLHYTTYTVTSNLLCALAVIPYQKIALPVTPTLGCMRSEEHTSEPSHT